MLTQPQRRSQVYDLLLLAFGMGSLLAWGEIRALGDVRQHLWVFYVWFAVAFVLYLAVLRLVSRHPRPSWMPLALILAVAILARATLVGTTPTLSDDLYRYRWDGRVQLAGIDPYRFPPNHPALEFLRDEPFRRINFPHLRTVYPPLTELAFRLGASLSQTLTAQKCIFLAAELLTVLSLLGILRRRGRSPLWVVAYTWHPLVILEIAGSGHNDALGVAALWLGVWAWEARAWLGVTVGWSAAFLSKFASAVLLPWWWFRREARGWLAACVVLAAAPLLLHWSALTALVESLSAMTTRFESNASVYLALVWLTRSTAIARVLTVALWAGFLFWWARRQSDPVRYIVGGFGAAALFSPVLHPWYLLWLIPCFCFWRVPFLIALTGTAVLSYTVWPGYLAGRPWAMPVWAHVLEYVPVLLFGLWELSQVIPERWLVQQRVVLKRTG